MAIFHYSVGHVSRSTGRSSVQSAAYITGSSLHETRRDLTANYSNRVADILFSGTLAPSFAPEVFKDISVWDKLETFEDEHAVKLFPYNLEKRDKYINSARTSMTVVVALPRELTSDVSHELILELVNTIFVSQGLFVTYGIHDDEGNPHAHLQISRRSIERDGTFSHAKNRTMCLKKTLLADRKYWADIANSYLEREGFSERITEKSFADLGINLKPTQHRGWVSDKLEKIGVTSRVVRENELIFDDNKNNILKIPDIILAEITSKQATFSQIQLLNIIRKRLGDDAKHVSQVFESVLHKALSLGVGIDGHVRYTSSSYKELEEKSFAELDKTVGVSFKQDIPESRIHAHIDTHYAHMSEEQRVATLGLLNNDRLSLLVGRAGTGKTTTTVKAVCELYQDSGHRVIGTSLSALASDNLGVEAGITSKTLHSWLYCWDRYQNAQQQFLSFDSIVTKGVLKQFEWYKDLVNLNTFKLDANTIIVVDEAGMIGTRQWLALLEHANRAGAKVIAVGDDHQFKAIEAGDFFRELKERAFANKCGFALNTIRRQKVEWMRDASQKMAELNIQAGLSLYEQHGHIHQTNTAYLEHDIADAYLAKLKTGQDGLVLAFTNKQADELNKVIRQKLRSTVIPQHLLSNHDAFSLGEGDSKKGFALGDKIVFLKNDKKHITITDKHGVILEHDAIKNGTTGILERVINQGEAVVVRLSSDKTAHFSISDYNNISYGYALTTHKSQGQTVDFALVAASKSIDAKGIYVAMTRHRHDVQLFYPREDFADFKALSLHLSRYDYKDLIKDYTIRPENTDAWGRIQEYQHCIYDAAALLRESRAEGDVDWTGYLHMKRVQVQLGKEILNNFDAHKHYLHQAGLTHEMLQITTGAKTRPLSLAEEKAKLIVEIYGETAKAARELWHDVRKTTPSSQHPSYQMFQELRKERDDLAKEILSNYPLYREFVNFYARTYSINKRTLENQVAYREKTMLSKEQHHKQAPTIDIHETNQKTMESIQKAFDTTHISFPAKKSETQFERTSAEIISDLTTHIKDLAIHFLGKPHQQNVRHWRYGRKGSVSIAVGGAHKGMYTNFETGVSGNVVTFIADQLNLNQKEAFKWGVQWLGYERSSIVPHTQTTYVKESLENNKENPLVEWTPTFPITEAFPNLRTAPLLRSMLKGRVETARYAYKDAEGNTLGYALRLEDKDGTKITPTLTYCQNDRGDKQWRWKGLGNDRPLYGLDQLTLKPNAPVLIVEGEKTCEAARVLFPQHAVITWSGGCGSVHKSDWSILKERDVTIWPDHDKAGLGAALKIGDILSNHGNNSTRCIDLPSSLPHKWDLADVMPEHLSLNDILSHSKTRDEIAFEAYQKAHSLDEKKFSFDEIYVFAQHNRYSHLIDEVNAPYLELNVNKAYKVIKTLNLLTKENFTDEEIKEQAMFSGIYGERIKEMGVQFKDNVMKEHALEIAMIAGHMYKESKIDDHILLMNKAKTRFLEIEQKVKQHLDNPPESLKEVSAEIKESIIRKALHTKAMIGVVMPAHVNKSLLEGMIKINPDERNHEIIQGVIDHVLHQKAHGEPPLHNLTHETLAFKMGQDQANVQKAVQQTHEKSLELEQQPTLTHRGFERTL